MHTYRRPSKLQGVNYSLHRWKRGRQDEDEDKKEWLDKQHRRTKEITIDNQGPKIFGYTEADAKQWALGERNRLEEHIEGMDISSMDGVYDELLVQELNNRLQDGKQCKDINLRTTFRLILWGKLKDCQQDEQYELWQSYVSDALLKNNP